MEYKQYLEARATLYGVYLKWCFDIERTEDDFKKFYASRARVCYYEESTHSKQKRNSMKQLENMTKQK